MATYKDFSGSSSYYDEIIKRLNSGDAKVVTSKPIQGFVYIDGETGTPIFRSYAEEGIDAVSKALSPAEYAQAKFNPQNERLELTSVSTVPPHIDLGGKEIAGMSQWPVEDVGGGNYRLSAMNSGESGYAQLVIRPDETGKATVTENNPASFQSYDAGNFFSNFAGAAEDLATSDAGKMLALAAAGGAFTPAAGAVGGGASALDAATAAEGFGGAGAVGSGGSAGLAGAPDINSLASSFYGLPEGSQYVPPKVTELGTVAGSTEGMLATPEVAGMGGAQGLQMPSGTNLAEMGGAQGLQSGVGTSLAEMGGAQGLTTAGAAGGVLGAAGLSSGLSTPAAAGIGAGLGLSEAASGTGSLLTGAAAGAGAGAAGAAGAGAAGTLTGSALGDMAAINAGAGLIGGTLQSNAAKDAAQIQAAAADRAIAQQQKNFETINAQQAPYRASGYGALNKIAQLGGGTTAQYDANGNRIADLASYGQPSSNLQTTTQPVGWSASPMGGMGNNPLGTPYLGPNDELLGYKGPNGFVDVNGNPVDSTGNSIRSQPSGQAPSDYLTRQFNKNDLTSGLAPNYDFMLGQGQMANQRAANIGGGALGGNALQGLNKFTQDYAGNAYQNAFTNFQNQRSNIYNTLASIAGIGQTGQSATNAAATNATNAATQLAVGSAGAQAAGTVGSANAYNNAISNAANNYTLASLLNQRGNVQLPVG